MELYVTKDEALVLVDRRPIITEDGAAYLRKGVLGLGGAHLSLIGEVDAINDSVMHGTYSGLLGGTAVLMDQYVQVHAGVPVTIVRVLHRVNGSAPVANGSNEALVMEFFTAPSDGGSDPVLTRN
jgi:hypothetical protein